MISNKIGKYPLALQIGVQKFFKFEKKGKMGEESQSKKTTRVVESLGWLTESSIMPKKQRAIAGVGPSSILELKAQLYKSQDESKKTKELSGPDLHFHRAKKILPAPTLFSAKNSGVDARALKYLSLCLCLLIK